MRPTPAVGADETEPMLHQLRELLRGERCGARGGQLDGERETVELRADARHGSLRAGIEHEVAGRVGGAAGEQPDGVVDLERREGVYPLAGHPQRLPTRGQHRHTRAGADYRGHDGGRISEHVLAVVEHDQQLAVAIPLTSHETTSLPPGCPSRGPNVRMKAAGTAARPTRRPTRRATHRRATVLLVASVVSIARRGSARRRPDR